MPAMDDTLGGWPEWCLRVRCRCQVAHLPLKLLAREHGPHHRIADIVARLRCSQCGERPGEATMTDNPARGMPGYVEKAPLRDMRATNP